MSAEDPSDAELECDANAHLGPSRHRPQLSLQSRALNPRELMDSGLGIQEAAILQQQELEQYNDDGGDDEEPAPPPPRPRPQRAAPPAQPRRSTAPAVGSALRRPTASLPRGLEAGRTEPAEHAQAWDRYVAAALVVAAQLGLDDPEGAAASTADRLLEERRRRFG